MTPYKETDEPETNFLEHILKLMPKGRKSGKSNRSSGNPIGQAKITISRSGRAIHLLTINGIDQSNLTHSPTTSSPPRSLRKPGNREESRLDRSLRTPQEDKRSKLKSSLPHLFPTTKIIVTHCPAMPVRQQTTNATHVNPPRGTDPQDGIPPSPVKTTTCNR